MEQRTIIKTADGSYTLYVSGLDEHYHSTNGAIQESMHVFIRNGYEYFKNQKEIHILEVGFGTGLNALLTFLQSRNSLNQVRYTAIEKYPVPFEIARQLNYMEQIPEQSSIDLLELHKVSWGEWQVLCRQFYFRKLETDLGIYKPDETFDLIYFDAFAPDKQPEMWREEIFKMMYEHLSDGGILVTYSAKGLIKRRLRSVGFKVKRLPGAPGKLEMLRAIKE